MEQLFHANEMDEIKQLYAESQQNHIDMTKYDSIYI